MLIDLKCDSFHSDDAGKGALCESFAATIAGEQPLHELSFLLSVGKIKYDQLKTAANQCYKQRVQSYDLNTAEMSWKKSKENATAFWSRSDYTVISQG